MAQITIATSICPSNIEMQQSAVSSWQALGFSVISVNNAKEKAYLQEQFQNVRFIVADRDASSIVGKPLVFIDDVLEALNRSGAQICGIVNSDIHLVGTDDFHSFITSALNGNLLFGPRTDISCMQDLSGEEYFGGFDFFFFDRSLIKLIPKTDFCLGAPWWDYWLPVILFTRGVQIVQLITPFAFHVNHPAKWSENTFEKMGRLFAGYLNEAGFSDSIDKDLLSAVRNSMSQRDLGPLSIFSLYFIKSRSKKISHFSSPANVNKYATPAKDHYHQAELLKFYTTQFNQLVDLLYQRENLSVARQNKLQTIEEQQRHFAIPRRFKEAIKTIRKMSRKFRVKK
ncbi:hypothetical protein [Geotalea toluenoxydans]